MAKKDEISSTEKLLGLIRQKENKVEPPAEPESSETFQKPQQQTMLSNVVSMRKRTGVGIDIGYHELSLAMVNQISDKRQELMGFISIPYEAGITPNSTKFPQFLRNTLKDFCGRNKKVALWNAISSAKVETRNLKIPKVSKKQIDNATYWTLKKDLSFNEDEMIFDYEVLGDVVEDGDHVDTMSRASLHEVRYVVHVARIETHCAVRATDAFGAVSMARLDEDPHDVVAVRLHRR